MNIDLNSAPPKVRKPLLQHEDEPDCYILQIDNSSLEVFTTCPRSAEFKLVHARSTRSRSALTYGGAIHAGLEAHYKGLPEDEILKRTFDYFDGVTINDWRTPDRAIDTIQRYRNRYKDDELKPDPDKVEIPFSLPLCSIDMDCVLPYSKALLLNEESNDNLYVKKVDVYWTGKIDLLTPIHGVDGFVDHKTTSMLGDTFWADFELSNQFLGYGWAASKIAGKVITRAMVNAIVGRPVTKTGTSTDFVRQVYNYAPEQIAEWEVNTITLVTDFLSNLHRGMFPMFTKWCMGKYGKCGYHDACTLPPSVRLDVLYSDLYENNTWSPLTSD